MSQMNETHKKDFSRCGEIYPLLCAYVDKTLSSEEICIVEAHTAECEGCRAELQMLTEAVGLIGLVPEVDPPAELRQEILASTVWRKSLLSKLRNRTAVPRWSLAPLAVASAIGAAAVFLAIGHRTMPTQPAVPQTMQSARRSIPKSIPQGAPTAAVVASAKNPSPLETLPESAPVAKLIRRVSHRQTARREQQPESPKPIAVQPLATAAAQQPSEKIQPDFQDANRGASTAENAASPNGVEAISAPEQALTASTQTVPAREISPPSQTTGPATEPDGKPKHPVMLAVVPPVSVTRPSENPSEEWRKQQFVELSRRLTESDVHGTRKSLYVDLVRVRF
ncbi:MAG: zf-HC2 domain-containing protein [Armatimonadota bacterium]